MTIVILKPKRLTKDRHGKLSSWPSYSAMVDVPVIYYCITKHYKTYWFIGKVITPHGYVGCLGFDCSLLESHSYYQMAAEAGIISMPDRVEYLRWVHHSHVWLLRWDNWNSWMLFGLLSPHSLST